jgi:membrane-associated protease RseP (regulator of RpoE activity)
MRTKLLTLALFLVIATSAFAFDDPVRRTIVVRDGNVLFDDFDPPGKTAFIGVSLTDLTPELREFFGASKDAGVLVSSVVERGPAAKAGVRVGDVITTVNGKNVAGLRDLREAIRENRAGDSIRIELLRGKSRQTVMAVAEERERPEARLFDLPGFDKSLIKPLPGGDWKQFMFAPENDALQTRIRELEKRLQDLERRLQQK